MSSELENKNRQPIMILMSHGYQAHLNIRGHKDPETENRPNNRSTWVTFSVSPAAPDPAATMPIG